MTPDTINAIAQFMNRVPLQPPEIPVWQQCMQELGKELERARDSRAPQKRPEGVPAPSTVRGIRPEPGLGESPEDGTP